MPELLLYGGKGGVGKTTCASAAALGFARRGARTLVVSTDPADSLSDLFETDVAAEPTQVHEAAPLYAVEVDPGARFDAYAETVDAAVAGLERVGVELPDTDSLDVGAAIGSDELAAVDLFDRYATDEDWERVVFDTAPTGHTLRLLRLPDLLDSTLGTALRVRSRLSGATAAVAGLFGGDSGGGVDLEAARSRLERVARTLRDGERTRFRPVMEPARLSLRETERLVDRLADHDVTVDRVVANRVLTDIDESCSLCTARRDRQQAILSTAREQFDPPVVTVPLLETPDADGALRRVARHLSGTSG